MVVIAVRVDESFDQELPNNQDDKLDSSIPDENKRIEARENNEQAMAYLTILILSHDLIADAKGYSDIVWPDGKAWKVWQVLKERAQPKDSLTEVQFRTEYHKIWMKDNEDPRLFFERLAAVEAKFNYKPIEAERLAQVFIEAENKYSTGLTSVEIAKCGKAKLEDLRIQMMSQYNTGKKTLRIRMRTITLTN